MKKNLSIKFALSEALYYSVYACVFSYAATYLQDMGFKASQVGVVLFTANFLSFSLQPVLGSFIDACRKNILTQTVVLQSVVAALCFASILIFKPGLMVFAVLYVIGLTLFDMIVALLNSINVFYSNHGYSIDYGLGRGAGGFGYAVVSLCIGYAMGLWGSSCTVIIGVTFLVGFAVLSMTYPKEEKLFDDAVQEKQATKLTVFFSKYSWYTASLLGVIFLGLVHVMIENYLIEIVRPLGGNTSNVGVALAIATFSEIPFLVFISKIVKKLGTKLCLIISGFSFTIKAVLFLLANNISLIYVGQLLQITTYVLLSPVSMYFAKECIPAKDMVKGQSLSTASYALGCAAGNLLGGLLITGFGVKGMLLAAIVFAVLGTAVFVITIPKALEKSALNV